MEKRLVEQIVEFSKTMHPNEPCSCGSGKKYKKCCANFDEKLDSILRE